jgi:hypothetical protein
MPVYFGLPVTCQEVIRLFNLDLELVKRKIIQEYKLSEHMFMDYYYAGYLNDFFTPFLI